MHPRPWIFLFVVFLLLFLRDQSPLSQQSRGDSPEEDHVDAEFIQSLKATWAFWEFDNVFVDWCAQNAFLSRQLETAKVALCSAKEGGSDFSVVITMNPSSARPPRLRLSNSSVLEQFYREFLGPDSFYIEAIGPEIAAFQHHDFLAPATYRFKLRLYEPGEYLLRVTHVYANFDAVVEVEDEGRLLVENDNADESLEMLNIPLLQERLTFSDVGTDPRPKSKELCREIAGKWRYFSKNNELDESITTSFWRHRCLPTCLVDKDPQLVSQEGEWRWLDTKAKAKDRAARGVAWVPSGSDHSGCRLPEWNDPHETQEGTALSQSKQCLLGKTLLFQGDSHLQRTLTHLAEWFLDSDDFREVKAMPILCENMTAGEVTSLGPNTISAPVNATCVYNFTTTPGDPSKTTSMGFSLSRHGERSLLGYHGYDAIIFNFGHWPSSKRVQHGGHWSLRRYRAQVKELVDTIKAERRLGQKVVWISSVAFPERLKPDSGSLVGLRTTDWRNNVRMELMNRVAEAEVRKAGFHVLDAFALTFPLKVSFDNNHYGTLHQRFLLRYLLNLVC